MSTFQFMMLSALLALLGAATLARADPHEHFNESGNAPSASTRALQQALRDSLPFSHQRDFEEHKRGFIAAPT